MSDVKKNHEGAPRRAYSSPIREEAARETRRQIRVAAERLFLSDGYAKTSMARIAKEAGVAEKTVYLAFPSKGDLLTEIIRVAVRGDDSPELLKEREFWRSISQAESAVEVIDRIAAGAALTMARVAKFTELAEAAAHGNPKLAPFRDHGHQGQRANMRQLAGVLADRGALRGGLDVEQVADVLYAIAPNESVYLRLVRERGWTDEQYTAAVAAMLRGLLEMTELDVSSPEL
ncbi:MAG: helix-turn-helix domain-containing protein [Solirubrobacteraceae bacterium]